MYSWALPRECQQQALTPRFQGGSPYFLRGRGAGRGQLLWKRVYRGSQPGAVPAEPGSAAVSGQRMLCQIVGHSCRVGVPGWKSPQEAHLMLSILQRRVPIQRQTPAWDVVRMLFLLGRDEPAPCKRQLAARRGWFPVPASYAAAGPGAACSVCP